MSAKYTIEVQSRPESTYHFRYAVHIWRSTTDDSGVCTGAIVGMGADHTVAKALTTAKAEVRHRRHIGPEALSNTAAFGSYAPCKCAGCIDIVIGDPPDLPHQLCHACMAAGCRAAKGDCGRPGAYHG